MFGALNDRNVVDDSVKKIVEITPVMVRRLTSTFIKYGKLIDQKFIDLTQSDERRRIKGVESVDSLLNLTFDKLLFALDRDLYIDFTNEVNNINSDYMFINEAYTGHPYDPKESIHGQDGLTPSIGSMLFIYLSNPYIPLKRITSDNYGISESVPLIKITPCCRVMRCDSNTEQSKDIQCVFYDYQNDDTSKYGIGLNVDHCSVSVDLCAALEILRSLLIQKTNFRREDKPSITEFNFFNSESVENEYIDVLSDTLTKRIMYSASTTYLAFVTKVIESENKPIDIIFSDILNSCRKTILNNYDSQGNDIKTGMGLRHMAIDISQLLNAISYSKHKRMSSEYVILENMINEIISYMYTTYNYKYIPFNNLKHKKLTSIDQIAKSQIYKVKPDTRAELQACLVNNQYRSQPTLASYFCTKDALKMNGSYSFNKRLFDTGKDFIDVLAKFIVIKKRMYDAGGLNFSDGTIDNIGKRYVDYKNYLKSTYEDLKVALSNIFARIKAITIGKRYLMPGNIAVKNSENEVIRNLNTLVFGINTESVLSDTYEFESMLFDSRTKSVDRSSSSTNGYVNTNRRIKDVRAIYEVLKNRECTYANNNRELLEAVNLYGNGSLVTFWIAINEAIGVCIFEKPFQYVTDNIANLTIGYGESSINEMAPNASFIDRDKIHEFDEWIQGSTSYKSIEDLRQSFEDLKEKVEQNEDGSETIFGGLLFGDFGGVPLAHDMTAKETELFNDQLSVHTINPEEIQSFEDLKNEFDEFLAKHI